MKLSLDNLQMRYLAHRGKKLTLVHLYTHLFRKEISVTLQNKCKVSYVYKALS